METKTKLRGAQAREKMENMMKSDGKRLVGIRIHLLCALKEKRTKAFFESKQHPRLCGPISAIAIGQEPVPTSTLTPSLQSRILSYTLS